MALAEPVPVGGGIERLHEAIAELPEKMRFCLQLRIYQERSYDEIGELLGISTGTVGAHINEAKRRLTEALLGQEGRGQEN